MCFKYEKERKITPATIEYSTTPILRDGRLAAGNLWPLAINQVLQRVLNLEPAAFHFTTSFSHGCSGINSRFGASMGVPGVDQACSPILTCLP